jgi:pilus assembly protein CpaF
MKLSERFDRRYQQTPIAVPATPPANGGDAGVIVAPVERRVVPREGAAPMAPPGTEQLRSAEQTALLSPALAVAKGEIHAQLLSRHAAAIDINNRAGIRRLLMQLTEDHFRAKPPAALVTANDKEHLVEILFDEVIGLGPLETLLRDPEVSEIMVNRPEQIFVERSGRIELTSLAFEDEDSLRRVIDRIVSTIGRRVDESEPMCDARLKDGSRVNVVIPPVAIYGPCLTIRKFGREVLTPERIVTNGGATEAILEYLDAAVKTRLNLIVSGGTGSGKTTLLNVLSGFIPPTERIVTCEDAAELRLRQVHVISLESKPQNVEGRGAISIRDLVRNSLRMRPDRLDEHSARQQSSRRGQSSRDAGAARGHRASVTRHPQPDHIGGQRHSANRATARRIAQGGQRGRGARDGRRRDRSPGDLRVPPGGRDAGRPRCRLPHSDRDQV